MTTELNSPNIWRQRISKCKSLRDQITPEWKVNVDFRRGKPFEGESDEDRVNVNLDWSKTKAKHAALFSQVPEVRLSTEIEELTPAVAVFAKTLNKSLRKSRVGAAVDESVIDCINAAGIGVVVVGFQRRTEEIEVPKIDISMLPPAQAAQMLAAKQIPMEKVNRTTDVQFTNRHISPTDLLWPVEFTNSDFDDAPWIGRSDRMTWAEAKNELKLRDEDRETILGAAKNPQETLKDDATQRSEDEDIVEFDEIYYWAYRFDPNETSYKRIKRMVFVAGLDKPVINGDWNGQQFDKETGTYVGACKFPIRVLTLTYISDDAIPPSDSAIGRPQVLELIKSRSQMVLQRERSIPIRGMDVTKIDPEVQVKLLDGTWQGMIPMNGPFQNAIWEVARANYPREDMEFDRVAKHDLDEVWQTGANQGGNFASGERSAREASIVQQNYQTRVGYERGRVAAFLLGIAEVHAGLLALYGDFDTEGWDRARLSHEMVFSILPDATVLLDANQKLDRAMSILNMVGKSGLINPEPIIKEIAELGGFDPTKLMVKPTPPTAEPLNISIRNAEDLRDPMMLALLLKTGQAPSPEELEAAKKMLLASQLPPAPEPVATDSTAPPMDEQTARLVGPNGNPENWNVMSKITKRGDYN